MVKYHTLKCSKCGVVCTLSEGFYRVAMAKYGDEGKFLCVVCRQKQQHKQYHQDHYQYTKYHELKCSKCSAIRTLGNGHYKNAMDKYGSEDKFLCVVCNGKKYNKVHCKEYNKNYEAIISERHKKYYQKNKVKLKEIRDLPGSKAKKKEIRCLPENKTKMRRYGKNYIRNGAKNPVIKITLESAITMVKIVASNKRMTATECLLSLGVSHRKFRSFLGANDLNMDEIAEMAGVEFATRNNGLGHDEKRVLDQIERQTGCKLIRQFPVAGYFVDGYDPIKNVAYERDERGHKYKVIEDAIREDNIKAVLGCKFIRIKEWK